MTGKDQKILSTLAKNLGLNSNDQFVLFKDLIVETIRESDPFSGNITISSDFLGKDTTNLWGKLTEDNGSAAAVQPNKPTGMVKLTTGTDDNGKAGMHSQLIWFGEKNAIFECRIVTPATITTYKMEIGFNDNLTAEVWGVLAEDGSGDASTDAIIFIWDTDKHATKLWVAGTANGTGWGGIDTGVTMEASTTYDFKIVLVGDAAYMYYKKVGTHTTWQLLYTKTSGAVIATADLSPWIVVVARSITASRDLWVDRMHMEQNR